MNVLRDFQQLQQDNCQEIEDNKGKKLLGRQRRNIAMHTPKIVWSIEETRNFRYNFAFRASMFFDGSGQIKATKKTRPLGSQIVL